MTSTASSLWTPVRLGALSLRHRVVLAPMTRRRAGPDMTPSPSMRRYYEQRAGFALAVTEGVLPALRGRGYSGQPGMLEEHADAWTGVADAVHEAGGRIVMQLMHAGRLTHLDLTGGAAPLAPSRVDLSSGYGHDHSYPPARPADPDDLSALIEEFVTAAVRAVAAGLDGVELHAANGYLLHQFLAPSTNRRDDAYGSSPAGRARFVVDVVTAVARAVGPDRLGLRISPGAGVRGALEEDHDDMVATYGALADGVGPLGIAYLSVVHPVIGGSLVQHLRARFAAPLVANTGPGSVTGLDEAEHLVGLGHADAVAVGRAGIANPDLPHRWRAGIEEATPDPATFYEGGDAGYVDYPAAPTGG